MKNAKSIDYALLLLRVAAGTVLFYYGLQKTVGAFGGLGFFGTLRAFEEGKGMHPALTTCAIMAEFFGAMGLIVGLLTRIAAFGIAATMMTAAFLGLERLNVNDAQTMPIVFYPAMIGVIALAILIAGPGQLSLDANLKGKPRRSKSA